MKLHTLGPKETDSYHAALYYKNENNVEIILHDSFESIIENFEMYKGDLFMLPTAFKSLAMDLCWGDVHYHNLGKIELKDAFIYDLNDLVIVENLSNKTNIGYTHSATARLLKENISDIELRVSKSKYQAYRDFQKDGQYVLTSSRLVNKNEKIIKKFKTSMIWSVYKIRK